MTAERRPVSGAVLPIADGTWGTKVCSVHLHC